MKKIVIIGGGIAGLAAAYYIHKEISKKIPVECIVLESSKNFGGKIVLGSSILGGFNPLILSFLTKWASQPILA